MKAFSILKAFRHTDEWLSSSDLSRRAHLPEASGYRLIQTLEDVGAVVRGPRGRYRLGLLLVSLAQNVPVGQVLRETSHDILSDLSKRLDMTIHMGMLENGMVTYIAKVTTPTSWQTRARVGSQLEAYCSGLGKVLLAALPDEDLENFLLEGDLVPLTPHTITDIPTLRAQLIKVRAQGYAIDDRENQIEMACLAVPVRDGDGRVVAALSATHSANLTPERLAQVRQQIAQAAGAISAKVFPDYVLEEDAEDAA